MKKLFTAIVLSLFGLTFNLAAYAAGDKGTAEEAVAMVKKATAFLKTNGKEKAFAEFSNPAGQFKDRDLYIFVHDLNGKMLAHGANPKLIGKDLIDLKDADGKLLIKGFVDIVNTKGKGWFDYKWVNPTTKTIDPKSTYVEKADDLVIGCGIYK